MDIILKAKELGTMIGSSDEMDRYKKAEAAVENDDRAKTLLNDYKLLQVEVVKATKENREKSIVESLKERLILKQEEINVYEITKEFLEAKSKFDGFMKQINDVIIFGITGEEPCSSGKCGSCSGCK